jgi:D-sedoheptulose 7-phosphate isomerase
MSAIGNDYGYESVFTRELLALSTEKDVFIPISTSGNSPNAISAINAGKEIGLKIYGLTGGSGGKMNELCETIIVADDCTEKFRKFI